MNFFSMCAENDPKLGERFQELLRGLGAAEVETLTRFAETVAAGGKIAVNMRPTVLQDLLASGRWFNIHEWAESIVSKSTKTKQVILQEKLQDFYERRIAFDRYFQQGESFRYGALNIGGLGAERFGEFCVVLRQESMMTTTEVGYLQSDSLKTYVTDEGVDGDTLAVGCSTDSGKHLLCALKHVEDLIGLAESRWPQMVCNPDEYVEVIFLGGLGADKLHAVRISRTLYELYYEYSYNEHREKLGELDRYRVDLFSRINEYMGELGLLWEEVA
jgi:hypothetical protein